MVIRSAVLLVLSGVMIPSSVAAQHEHSPYAGQDRREIKALSQQEVEELLAGEGMGLARAAELNGYPGPRHVLELAQQLRLAEAQVGAVREIFRRMREAAVSTGREVVERERALDRAFASGAIAPGTVDALTAEIAELRGRLRAIHLGAHLETAAMLEAWQIEAYDRLRGYRGAGTARHDGTGGPGG